jgi:hypothetical protein
MAVQNARITKCQNDRMTELPFRPGTSTACWPARPSRSARNAVALAALGVKDAGASALARLDQA